MRVERVRARRNRDPQRRARPDRAADLLAAALREPGAPLAAGLRETMEARFRHDLGSVRVHNGPRAQAAADALGAHALAVGNEVLFAAGRFDPEDIDGRMLLAHELAHVLQGGGGAEATLAHEVDGEVDLPDEPTPAATLEQAPNPHAEDAIEQGARAAAARALSGAPPEEATLAPAELQRSGRVARLVRELPLQAAAAPLADPFVEVVAVDFVRALEREPGDPPAGLRRRLARLPDPTRAAVVERVRELLPASQRERAAEVLTDVALGRSQDRDDESRETASADRPGVAATSPEREAQESPPQTPAEVEQPAPFQPEPEPEPGPEPDEPSATREEGATEAPTPSLAEQAAGEPRPAGEPGPADPAEKAEPAASTAGDPGAGVRTADEESAAAAPAGETAAGGPDAPADLGPLDELQARVEREGREREEAARAQESVAEAIDNAAPASVPTAPLEGEAATAPPAGEPAPSESQAPAAEAAPQPEAPAHETAAPAESGPGPEPATADTGAPEIEGPDPLPAEPVDAPEPAPAELALSKQPEPSPPPLPPGVPRAEADSALPQVAGPEPTGAPAGESEAVDTGADAQAVDEVLSPAPAGEPPVPDPAEPAAADGGAPADAAAAGAAASGDCGPDVGGGGGAGAAVEPEPQPPPPDVSAAEPAAAMGAVASLPPAELGRALGNVGAAAARDVGEGRTELAASPPAMERPAGSPETRPIGVAAAPGGAAPQAEQAAALVEHFGSGGTSTGPQPVGLPPAPAAPTRGVAVPTLGGGAEGQLTAADAQAVAASVDQLPVTDPGLELTAGPAPTVALEGDASPERAREQRTQLNDGAQAARDDAAREAAVPLGEHDVYPDVPPETLTAAPPATTAAVPAPVPGPEVDEATAIVARDQQSEPVRAAATQAQGQMAGERESHDAQVEQGRTQARTDIDETLRANTDEQRTRREAARRQVQGHRGRWSEGQNTAVVTAHRDADAAEVSGSEKVEHERTNADRDAAQHIERGNEQAQTARLDAERDARTKRDRGRHESRGVLTWLADQARGFFDALKRGIQAIFDAARAFVRRAIQEAQRLASEVVDAARRAIVAAIRVVGDALIAIGDRLLAAFPTLRDRFRAAIRAAVDRAVAAVNVLADALKAGIQLALSLLGTLIEGYLNLLERAYTAAVDFVANAVQSAISAAQAVVQAMGQFAALVVDIAANPGQWLRNLGAAVVDGIRNHVWRAIKCAVKNWFNSKIEALLGMAQLVWNLLRSGGIRFAEIGRMVWEALKQSLPGILIQLAIEKLVSLLVPAASALMLIIDGLRAAYGAISRIVAAFETFFRFLRAVRGGNAGRQFAEALVAGAIALIDFLSNFLLLRLRGPAQGVAGRLRALAGQIGARLRRIGQAVARGVRRVSGAVRRGGRGAAGAIRTGLRRAGRMAAGVARRGAAAVVRVVRRLPGVRHLGAGFRQAWRAWQTLRRLWQRARVRVRAWRERRRRNAEERRRRRRQRAHERLQRAITALRPAVGSLLHRGVARLELAARFLGWSVQHGLRRLWISRTGRRVVIRARANPVGNVEDGFVPSDAELASIIGRVVRSIRRDPAVLAAARRIESEQRAALERGELATADLRGGADLIGSTVAGRARMLSVRRILASVREMWDAKVAQAGVRAAIVASVGALARPVGVGRFSSPGRPGSIRQRFRLGKQEFTEWQGSLAGAGQARVPFPGRGGRYPHIAANLAGADDRGVAQGIRRLISTGDPIPGVQGSASTRLAYLMFGRESARRPRNIAHAAMTMQMIERGDLTFDEAFARAEPRPGQVGPQPPGGGGAYPMSRVATGLNAETVERETQRREADVARRWLLSEARRDQVMFDGPPDLEGYVNRKLREFYGLDRSGGPGAAGLARQLVGSGT